jgi:hypothetical protein
MKSGFSGKKVLSFCKLASILLLFTSLDAAAQWQQGFDFRNTADFVRDPPSATCVLPTTAHPTTMNGVTYGWVNNTPVQGRDRDDSLDPRLAGINFVSNGSQATFCVDLPSPAPMTSLWGSGC